MNENQIKEREEMIEDMDPPSWYIFGTEDPFRKPRIWERMLVWILGR